MQADCNAADDNEFNLVLGQAGDCFLQIDHALLFSTGPLLRARSNSARNSIADCRSSILSCGVCLSFDARSVRSTPNSFAASILLPGRGFKSFCSGVRVIDLFYGNFTSAALFPPFGPHSGTFISQHLRCGFVVIINDFMANPPKQKPPQPKQNEKETDSWADDQAEHRYYYDDAHGYEVYKPDEEDDESTIEKKPGQ